MTTNRKTVAPNANQIADTENFHLIADSLICFSHLRWDFVFQRPQQLLTRFAGFMKVYFIEEPVFIADIEDFLVTRISDEGIFVIVPHIQEHLLPEEQTKRLRTLMDVALCSVDLTTAILWYYNPMAYQFTNHLNAALIVYDCMDELSAFKFAPTDISIREEQLMRNADIVFTGGRSLFNAKKDKHSNVYFFPSSIDKDHFRSARQTITAPEDQLNIPHPRLGFFGVIDERFDVALIKEAALAQPGWQFIFLGPVVKISPDCLPQGDNIHFLGSKPYRQLPQYLAGWDIALIPFELNESTRFISPTKTPEYLAAGVPVISTPIEDVINPYGVIGLVHIVGNGQGLIHEAKEILSGTDYEKWIERVDEFLEPESWDNTCLQMMDIIMEMLNQSSPSFKSESNV